MSMREADNDCRVAAELFYRYLKSGIAVLHRAGLSKRDARKFLSGFVASFIAYVKYTDVLRWEQIELDTDGILVTLDKITEIAEEKSDAYVH